MDCKNKTYGQTCSVSCSAAYSMNGRASTLTYDTGCWFSADVMPNCTLKSDAREIKVTGSVNVKVENKTVFCADTELLDAFGNALAKSAKVDNENVEVSCAAQRRLQESLVGRKLAESVKLDFKIKAIAASGQDSSTGASLVSAVNSITMETLAASVGEEMLKLGRSVNITVSDFSPPTQYESKHALGTDNFTFTPVPMPSPSPVPTPVPSPTPTNASAPSPSPKKVNVDDNGALRRVSCPMLTLMAAGFLFFLQSTV